jgi:hypothetical protein
MSIGGSKVASESGLSRIGDRIAREVKPPEIADIVRAAKEQRVNGNRRIGGAETARRVLREAKAIFAHGVGTGVLDHSPAATLQARSFGISAHSRRR